MKVILVIDEPNKCAECPVYDHTFWRCNDTATKKRDITMDKLSDCPLKPMPEKSDYEPKDDYVYNKVEILAYTYGLTVGRNLVIDEILGDE